MKFPVSVLIRRSAKILTVSLSDYNVAVL
ncbi:MAG: hypothetical protein EZS28_046298, partial [Streblomastix strix]